MRIKLFPLFAIVGLWSVVSGSTTSAQLPDETQLPTYQLDRESSEEPLATMSPVPDETALPGAANTSSDDSQPSTPAMPSELVLQRDEPAEANVAAEKVDPPRFDSDTPGDQQPILRLNYNGHSGRVNVVRFSDDGNQLVTAGQDKDVHVWQRDPRRRDFWIHQRTIRWQVWRGPRGSVNDLAIRENEVAIAGYGAMGGTGEVWIADTLSGKLIRSLADYDSAHRMTVDSLAWSMSASSSLLSADLAGRVVRWSADEQTGKWNHQTIIKEDTETYGEATAKALKPFRRFHPVATFANEIATLQFNRMQVNKQPGGDEITFPVWQVQLHAIDNSKPPQTLADQIPGLVTQLRCSADETVLAAACLSAHEIKVWRRRAATTALLAESITVNGNPLYIDLSADGKRLLVGTEAGETPATVALYDLTSQPARQIDSLQLGETAAAGVVDPAGQSVILAIGNTLQVYALGPDAKFVSPPRQVLQTPIEPITRVAASIQADPLRVAISREKTADGEKPLTEVFNLTQLSLEAVPQEKIDAGQFLQGQRLDENVTIRPATNDPNASDLYMGESRIGKLPLSPESHGRPTTVSSVEINGSPFAIVGTEGQNNVYIFSLTPPFQQSELKITRQFRGHFGAVRSTSATADGRYLLTGGDDATLCVWNLDDVAKASDSMNRWGATFEILEQKLTVVNIDEAGPLYFRGVRLGDQLKLLKWANEQGENQTADSPDTMLATLNETAFDTQVFFEIDRQGQAIAAFQMFPAWYPLATVLIDNQREWAVWTPAGIYNASLAGNQRFGWQLNRGLNTDVEFFRADQFRASLERPEVMRRLISAGSLAAAMRPILGGGPPPGETAIVNQIASRPRIQILSPLAKTLGVLPTVGPEPTLEVVARIESPPGVGIESVKAFIDGIPGMLNSQNQLDSTTMEARWMFKLPRQTAMQLDVYAATGAKSAARETIRIRRIDSPEPSIAKLRLLAMGVSKYADPNIQSLDFAAQATDAVARSLQSHAGSLYDVTTTQLVNSQATRSLWQICAGSTLDELRETVGPDDLVVMYLCGHGIRDRRTGQWYFVSADADYRDLMNDQYDDCLSLSDLSVFAKLPCRKLAILDSCHSGAVQSYMREDDLKSAIRVLQDDVVMTITASEGREEAAEVAEAGLGRFTSRLLEAFAGRADSDRDGEVSLRETVHYVSRTVSEDSRQDGMSQHPTAGPRDLIERLDLPLTRLGQLHAKLK